MVYSIDAKLLCRAFISGANRLCNHKNVLNELNVFPVPDGDTGSNMSMTVMAATKELLEKEFTSVDEVMSIIAGASLRGARGNSGVILSQLFRGMQRRLKGNDNADINDLADAFKEGVDAAYRAVMKPTEGTILTVAREAAEAGTELAKSGEVEITALLEVIVNAAQESLNRTPELLPQLKQAGVVDSGGQGIVYLYEGFLSCLKTGEITDLLDNSISPVKTLQKKEVEADIKYAYCTEFIVNKSNNKITAELFRKNISKKGDSMVVIDDEDIIKVHIHTNNPGYVIEEAIKLGSLINIKIDNMKYQHNNLANGAKEVAENKQAEPKKDYGFAAVAVGEGITQIFKDMGIDAIIEGGQTMNPSTDDILHAIEEVNASTVYVFPNNKNIIMAAEQVVSLTEVNVVVIPTRSIPEGINAKLSFDASVSADENKEKMIKSIKQIKTGNVTYAVRDTSFQGKDIKEGDIIGITGGNISVVGKKPDDVVKKLLKEMTDEDSEVISVFYGNEISEKQAEDMKKYLDKSYGDCDILFHNGGQPLYYYIISVE